METHAGRDEVEGNGGNSREGQKGIGGVVRGHRLQSAHGKGKQLVLLSRYEEDVGLRIKPDHLYSS